MRNGCDSKILLQDAEARTACTISSSGHGTEERLTMDLTELRAEEALLRSRVDATELKIQRCGHQLISDTSSQRVPSYVMS